MDNGEVSGVEGLAESGGPISFYRKRVPEYCSYAFAPDQISVEMIFFVTKPSALRLTP
jgi:hypothetical protein